MLYVGGKPQTVILDYELQINAKDKSRFRLFYHPHELEKFKAMLKEVFGATAKHEIYGDFQALEEAVDPGFFIHAIENSQ